MAIGDYLRYSLNSAYTPLISASSVAEDDHRAAERRRELWEIENVPEKEKQEMVDVYLAKGVSQEDAQRVVDLLWPHKEAFLGPFYYNSTSAADNLTQT